MRFSFILFFSLMLSNCETINRNDSSYQFFGVYKSLPLNESSISLSLKEKEKGTFVLSENREVPVLWRESLSKLILSYSDFTAQFQPVETLNSMGESKMGLQYLDRPNVRRGPFSPLNLIKTE